MERLLPALIAAACLLLHVPAHAALDTELLALQQAWAQVYYGDASPQDQAAGFEQLARSADGLAGRYPQRAEPLIWSGIVRSCHAGVTRGRDALRLAKTARDRFEEALRLDATALRGAGYAGLGALYYRVPGFPLAFGDDRKAGELLTRAVALDPEGLDTNFFYGEWLAKQGRYRQALERLDLAARAAPRPGLEVADRGRSSNSEKRDVPRLGDGSNLDIILDIPLEVTVELGRTKMPIRDLLQLGPGSALPLSRLEDEPVDILANNKLIARGVVLVKDEKYGIRITEITGRLERLRGLR